ncbi:hypothetical protein LPI63_14280, partial [Klebsiella pneumoniae]|nr:hypothetical protein [Klebsiella pneumoniae]
AFGDALFLSLAETTIEFASHDPQRALFLSEAYRAFGDALFLSLAETTIEFASHDPQRAREIIALGFEAMWHALHEADA